MKQFKHIMLLSFLVFSVLISQPVVMGYEFTRETCEAGLTPNLNIKDSLLLSAVTACIPGILEKAYEYKQIKCEEVVCTYEALKSGLDPEFCSKQRAYKTCRYVTSEIFAFPGINFIEAIREGIAQYLANPYAIVATGMRALRASGSTCWGWCDGFVGSFMSTTLAINDLAAFAQRISDILENGIDGLSPDSGVDYCEQIPEIEQEVNKILQTA